MNDILHGLNSAQLEAVTSQASVLQVLAPPGSGKTKTLTARVAHLIVEQGFQPWNIIVCTFTVKAANEMKARINSVVGEEFAKKLLLGTFHSVALRYLKHYGHHIGLSKDFGVADTSDSKAILKRIIKQSGMSIEPGQALGRISSQKVRSNTLEQQSQKARQNVEQQEFTRVFEEYEAMLAASNLLDYDDLLLRCSFLLKTCPECVSNVQAVLIDEFQDTNTVQYELMALFAQRRNVITIVGDPDQSIYGFRSAEIKNLSRMKSQWPDTLTINLEENYRSSGAILKAAQHIIEQDESRPQKQLQPTHKYGLRPILRKIPSASAEADWLVSELKRVQTLSGNMLRASDFAILLRSSALSRAIESSLGAAGVPYRMVGGLRFYDRYEVKLVVDYLRVVHNPGNSEAVERVLNVPSRKVGEETIKKLREEAHSKGVTIWDLILDIAQARTSVQSKLSEPAKKGLESFVNVILSARKKLDTVDGVEPSVVDLINVVSQKISLQAHLRAKDSNDEKAYEARWANVEELIAQAEDLATSGEARDIIEADRLPVIDGLEQDTSSVEDVLAIFLANIALASSTEQKADGEAETVPQVTISTIHAAKGLEWPVVFVPACYEGSIPHSRADDNDEERRLLYVAMTRAQALLYLSCPMKSSQREETTMSSFLTHSGVQRHFEEHGPSLTIDAVTSLSHTLRRACPEVSALTEAKSGLSQDEDNHWPVNGEEPLGNWEASRWDRAPETRAMPSFGSARLVNHCHEVATTMQQSHNFSVASSTMRPGFTSAKARYDEVRQEQEQLRQIDKRAKEHAKAQDGPKGNKRQLQSHGDISAFFSKRPKCSEKVVSQVQLASQARMQSERETRALQDISNTVSSKALVPSQPVSFSAAQHHKPRTAPLAHKPRIQQDTASDESENRYIFLSSSPPPEVTEPDAPEELTSATALHASDTAGFRPTSTLHKTSMDRTAPQRKTYGLKRSLHGWPPKPRT